MSRMGRHVCCSRCCFATDEYGVKFHRLDCICGEVVEIDTLRLFVAIVGWSLVGASIWFFIALISWGVFAPVF